MSEQENVTIVRKWFDNLNSHNLDHNDQFLANDVRVEAAGAPGVMNRDQGRAYNQQFLDAFPDLHFDLKDIIAQGDLVSVSWVAKGTHKAPLKYGSTGITLSPTNRMATVPGCTITEVRNNKIVRQSVYWDQVTFLTQLGVLTEQDIMASMRR